MPYPTMSTTIPWSLVRGGFKKGPRFNNVRQETAARHGNGAFSLMPYATWDFEVDLSYVEGGEGVQGSVLQSFLGCYMATRGGGTLFYFTDPNDSTVDTGQGVMLNVTPAAPAPMGEAGDGASTIFQLARTIDAARDILQNVTVTGVYVDAVALDPDDYTVGPTGVVTFVTAPDADAVLTWDGTFKYLCRFNEDTLQGLARVNKNNTGFLWECPSLSFKSEFVG